jgi:outer membrane protein assembly factor BamB
MRRRLIVVLAVAAVLISGYVAIIVIHRFENEPDIRGSSTEEFSLPTTTAVPRPQARLGIQWPQYGFDTERTRAVDAGLRPPYRRIWWYGAGSLVEFPPVIGYGRLFFSTNSGKFAAINMNTGKRAWKYLSHRCVAASPALGSQQHGTVYAVFLNKPPCNARSKSGNGEVIAFSAGVGKVRWQKTIGPSETSPLLVGNRLYVGDWNGRVWALDARTGRTIWQFRTRGAVKAGAALSGRRLYVASYDGNVYCLAASTGRLIWKSRGQRRLFGASHFYSTPTVAYGRVFIGSTDGKVYSFGATTGKLIWSHETGNYVYASPAVWNGLVLIGSYSKRFYAFDAATGDSRWTFHANGEISGSPTVIDGVVYFATFARRTYALRARSGKLLWTYPDGKYSPAVAARGRLFLVGYGKVYGMVEK